MTSANDLFFSRTGLDRAAVERITSDALKGADDGEMYLEYRLSESFLFDDGRMKSASFDTTQGFGLRAVAGEAIQLHGGVAITWEYDIQLYFKRAYSSAQFFGTSTDALHRLESEVL